MMNVMALQIELFIWKYGSTMENMSVALCVSFKGKF